MKIGRVSLQSGVRSDTTPSHRLAPLVNVLRTWGKLTNLFCETLPDDAPYYYNERPNVSLLAASAWKAGFVALEEYQTDKKSGDGKTFGRGRTDLYIGNRTFDIVIEAKQYWLEALNSEGYLSRRQARIKSCIDKAVSDAKKNTDSTRPAGCAFFVPVFPQTKFRGYSSKSEQYIKAELRQYIEESGHHADLWAWAFPKQSRNYREKSKAGKYRYYPGIILALKAG